MILLLATRSRKKGRELQRLLRKGAGHPPIRVVTLDRFPDIPPVRETGRTFRENAVRKAVLTSGHTILPVLADDSGLEVRALGGMPGVKSARFAGPRQDDEANNRKLLRALSKVLPSRRQGRFVCVLALAAGGRLLRTFQGTCSGSIALEPAGRTGFGYDPLFIPRGRRRTMAQLGPGTKDRISHRAKAVSRFRDRLKTAL